MVDNCAPRTNKQWDAGEAGCSQLIVGLKERIARLNPGEMIKVRSRNSGASIDIFVWCRMTGHRLISEAHPIYVIQKAVIELH